MSPPRPSPDFLPSAAFLGCSLVWGSTFLVISFGNDAVPPFWAAALRLGLAAPVLAALTWSTGQRLPGGAALRAAAGFGFLNFGLSFCLLYWGELSVPSGQTAVVYATIPLSTALLARAGGLERLSAAKVAGAVVSLGGVALMFSDRMVERVDAVPLAAVLLAATCASASGVVLKRGPRQSPLGANAAGAVAGFGVCLAASLLAGEERAWPATREALLPILYLTLAGSVFAFVTYAWLVNRWPVTRISFIAVVVPVIALALGSWVRGERMGAAAWAGSGLVLAGLALAIRGERGAPSPPAASPGTPGSRQAG